MPPAAAVDAKLDDLAQFDPATLAWTSLSDRIGGAAPRPRAGHGFAALGGKVRPLRHATGSGYIPVLALANPGRLGRFNRSIDGC